MRKLVPVEVYPLLISVSAAVFASAYALKRKWFNDPGLTVSKERRAGGTSVAYEGIVEARPFWTGFIRDSGSMFNSAPNKIFMTNRQPPAEAYVALFPSEQQDEGEDGEEESAADGGDAAEETTEQIGEIKDQALGAVESAANVVMPEPVQKHMSDLARKDEESEAEDGDNDENQSKSS